MQQNEPHFPLFHLFSDLPDELQSCVLSFLTPRELLLGMQIVCRRWHDTVLSDSILWQKVHATQFGGPQRSKKKEGTKLSWRDTCIFACR